MVHLSNEKFEQANDWNGMCDKYLLAGTVGDALVTQSCGKIVMMVVVICLFAVIVVV